MKCPVFPSEIRQVLSDRGLAPNKRFGQNFLIRPDVLDRVVAAADLKPREQVLEIGPGLGALTERLLAAGARVLAVEIDGGMARWIADALGGNAGLSLLQRDIMGTKSAIDPDVLRQLGVTEPTWKVVSNLPYQISSPFLSGCALLPVLPAMMVVTLQKEVGDVLLADPGSEAYSTLTVACRLAFRVERLMILPPDAFWPAPKVRSAVVRLIPRPTLPETRHLTVTLARGLFRARRKVLRSSLPRAFEQIPVLAPAASRAAALLERVGVKGDQRVETLSPEVLDQLVVLARVEIDKMPPP